MNKNRGFTLIELLAVLVILSIIALIAVPAISGVIDDSQRQTAEQNVELFVKSFNTAVSNSALNGTIIRSGSFTTEDGHIFTETTSNKTLNVPYNGRTVICDVIELYEDGNMYLSGCIVDNYELEDYTYGVEQE